MEPYKRYCAPNYHTDHKTINGLSGVTPGLVSNLLTNPCKKQTKDRFRKMSLTIETFDDSLGQIEDFLESKSSTLGEIPMISDLVSILYGDSPEWELVNVEIYMTHIIFFYYYFSEDGKAKYWLNITLSAPYSISLKIDIEPDNHHAKTTYKITMISKNNNLNANISIELYSNDIKKYSSRLLKDVNGIYELITVA